MVPYEMIFFFSQDIPRGYCEYNFSAKESAVKKPLEKHPLHIKVFDQESVHFGTATVDLSKIFSDEATRTLESRSYLGRDLYIGKNQKLCQNQNSKWRNFAKAKHWHLF